MGERYFTIQSKLMDIEDNNLSILNPCILIFSSLVPPCVAAPKPRAQSGRCTRFLPQDGEAIPAYDCQAGRFIDPGKEADAAEKELQTEVEALSDPLAECRKRTAEVPEQMIRDTCLDPPASQSLWGSLNHRV